MARSLHPRRALALLIACASLSATAASSTSGTGTASNSSAGGTVLSTQPLYTHAMQRLQEAADRLRQSIQALAHKPPGPERANALDAAQTALIETQQAMVAMPPEMRSWGSASTGDYDKSVQDLMKSAESLRQAVQQMAQYPAGSDRDKAIRSANRALLDTQSAVANAYAATASPSTQAMGAAPAHTGTQDAARK